MTIRAVLGQQALRQIQRLVRDEMLTAKRHPIPARAIHSADQGIYIAKTNPLGIEAMTTDVAALGICTVQRFNADDTLSDALDSAGKPVTIKVWNISAGAIAGDTLIQVKQELATGRLVVDFEKC